MRKRLTGRKAAAFLFAACITGAAFWPVSVDASELDNTANETNVPVDGDVQIDAAATPSYVVRIPSSLSFGTLKAPLTDTDDFKNVNLDVTLVEKNNIAPKHGICVFVKDGNNSQEKSGFSITNSGKGTSLQYDFYTLTADGQPDTNLVEQGTWYSNGWLFGIFGANANINDVLPGQLTLNQRQLFGQSADEYNGGYTGKLHFYTAVKGISDVPAIQ